jgi:hypothetical protein
MEIQRCSAEAMAPAACCLLEDNFCHWYLMLVGVAASKAVGAGFVVVVMAIAAKALALKDHALLDKNLR